MRVQFRWLFVIVCGLLWLPLARAVKIQFQSDPTGAVVTVVGPEDALRRIKTPTGTAPCELDLPRSTILQVRISKEGFETIEVPVNTREQPVVKAALQPIIIERTVTIESTPAGAEVLVNGVAAGTTPLTRPFRFERSSSRSPWKVFTVRVQNNEYQPEEMQLVLDSRLQVAPKVAVELGRISEDRVVEIVAMDDQGKVIPRAELLVNDKPEGNANEKGVGQVKLPFRRPNRTAAWNEFTLVVAVKNEYRPVERKQSYADPLRHEFRLSPVTEVSVKRFFPSAEMTSRGPRIVVDTTEVLGILDSRDLNSPATEMRLITNHDRRQPTVRAINSFALTPDGKNIIFSQTQEGEEGRHYSNLILKSVQSATSATTQLTQGSRFLDCYPAMSGEEGSTLVVFQSNRGVPNTWDISAVRLVEGQRIVGGVQQLTRDPQFNYGAVLASEQHPVFFSSVEETPGSLPRITSVRADGSTLTSHGETGESLSYSASGLLYLSRPDPHSGKFQIYSLGVDGQILSTVLNDEQLATSNCRWPSLSPTSDRLLFVSDYEQDEKGRRNNNIFVYDLKKGGKAQQLTSNGSDDIMPRWSPTEPNVIYFLSNRQGVYNVWRMSFRLQQ